MDENNHFVNGAYLVTHLRNIVETENDLESMIKDDIVDVLIDEKGIFHYRVNDKYFDRLKEMNADINRKTSTFSQMCFERGIDMNIFKRFFKKN